MISFLKGTIVQKLPNKLILDVNGVGYELLIPLSTYQKLKNIGDIIQILTYLHLRENLVQLFGFHTTSEKNVFTKLISVSGIGPQVALDALSALSPNEIRRAIITKDADTLTRINRVGKKLAQRMLLELKDAFRDEEIEMPATVDEDKQVIEEAVMAMMALGYREMESRSAIVKAMKNIDELTTEDLVREALQCMRTL